MSLIIRTQVELKLSIANESIKYYEKIMNDFRLFTMAIAEEEEVLKFYFYARYLDEPIDEMIFVEVVIDRGEKTIGLTFKYENKRLFDFWNVQLLDYLRSEDLIS